MLAIGLFVFFMPDAIVSGLAHFVVREDELDKSDVIVVIGGAEDRLRTDYGINLLKQGYAPKIIFSGMVQEKYAYEQLEEKGIDASQYWFESTATTTFENADNLVTYVKDNDIHSILLVSSPVQSRRAKFMFEKVFPDVEIISVFSPDSVYDPDKIFEDKGIREQLTNEITKLAYYYIKYAGYSGR